MTDQQKRYIEYFKSKHSELVITNAIDYTNNVFLIEAIDLNGPQSMDTWYAIKKSNNKITNFVPALELDYFLEALDSDRNLNYSEVE